jgi:hypothetical protein
MWDSSISLCYCSPEKISMIGLFSHWRIEAAAQNRVKIEMASNDKETRVSKGATPLNLGSRWIR